jgi:hypothetical protein
MCAHAPLSDPGPTWFLANGEKDVPVNMRLSWRLVIALAIASLALASAPMLAHQYERSGGPIHQTEIPG